MHKLIEQQQVTPTYIGGSLYILIPARWVDILKVEAKTPIFVRICEGKKGKFIDVYKVDSDSKKKNKKVE